MGVIDIGGSRRGAICRIPTPATLRVEMCWTIPSGLGIHRRVLWSGRSSVTRNYRALVQDAMEMANLVRSLRNALTPIDQMPPEVFSLIPHHQRECEGG